MFQLGVVALFPSMITEFLSYGINARAFERGICQLHTWPIREEATDPYRTVDDRSYGGGPGMVLKCEPVFAAIEKARQTMPDCPVIYASPQGQPLTQKRLRKWSELNGAIFLAGRYEGIDERVLIHAVDEECSIGDYVLSGGETAICVMLDGLIRLLPGALHDPESAVCDSFSEETGLLDHPHYTRPRVFRGHEVPAVLLSGDHEAIARYRRQQAWDRTCQKRPDLLQSTAFSSDDQND